MLKFLPFLCYKNLKKNFPEAGKISASLNPVQLEQRINMAEEKFEKQFKLCQVWYSFPPLCVCVYDLVIVKFRAHSPNKVDKTSRPDQHQLWVKF